MDEQSKIIKAIIIKSSWVFKKRFSNRCQKEYTHFFYFSFRCVCKANIGEKNYDQKKRKDKMWRNRCVEWWELMIYFFTWVHIFLFILYFGSITTLFKLQYCFYLVVSVAIRSVYYIFSVVSRRFSTIRQLSKIQRVCIHTPWANHMRSSLWAFAPLRLINTSETVVRRRTWADEWKINNRIQTQQTVWNACLGTQ